MTLSVVLAEFHGIGVVLCYLFLGFNFPDQTPQFAVADASSFIFEQFLQLRNDAGSGPDFFGCEKC